MAKKKPTRPTDPRSLRSRLKKLDGELLRLLEERQALVAEAGAQTIADDESRLDKLLSKAKKATQTGVLGPVLREVLAAERAVVGPPLRVAYLGPENTFSHLAAVHRFGVSADLVPVGSIAAVFAEVDRGNCLRGVVPLENSTDGRVSDTLECFSDTSARICGELPLRIHHCLLGSGDRSEIKQVLSKPQALSQCRNWLAKHLPQAQTQAVASTADAARQAKADASIAAIASERAAGQLGLAVLARHIEDQRDNITRFAVIGPQSAPPSKKETSKKEIGADKTALMFEMPHQPGALADAMGVFKRTQLNMTWIESFPIPGSRGSYRFFVEFEGHQTELRPRRAIASLSKKATRFEVLGSYPATEPID